MRKRKTKYMPMITIVLEEENKKPLLIDIMCVKRKIHAMKKRIVKQETEGHIFFMRHVMSFVIDMYEKREKLT